MSCFLNKVQEQAAAQEENTVNILHIGRASFFSRKARFSGKNYFHE